MTPNPLDEATLEHWHDLLTQEQADMPWLKDRLGEEATREQTRAAVLDLLQTYVNGENDTEQFRSVFDRKTRKEWDNFGLKGLNCAMFLNQLVKYVPDQEAVMALVRASLPAPDDVTTARHRLQAMADFIRDLHKQHTVSPMQLQVARVPPFLSSFWHLQNVEMWPIFYVSGRQTLEAEGLYTATQDPVEDYFSFRTAFQALASALGLSSWELERLLIWWQERHPQDGQVVPATPPAYASSHEADASVQPAGGAATADAKAVSAHTQIQLLLAKIGKKLGCNVWIAANDQGRQCEGGKLGDWSIKALPNLGLDANTQKIISLIDVLWLKGAHQVAAAFEIEHTTSIYSGLLRLSDLVAMSPNLNFPMYIVSPNDRLEDVRRELSRPTFQALELHKRCGYFAEEALQAKAEHIMEWANSPSAIDKLAQYVGDVTGEES